MKMKRSAKTIGGLVALSGVSACALIAGIPDETLDSNRCFDPGLNADVACDAGAGKNSGGAGGATGSNTTSSHGGNTSTSASASGTGGSGGGEPCTTGQKMSCYTGPAGTENVGACKSGMATCADAGFGACEGSVLPTAETCANPTDEDCDGNECAEWAHLYGDKADQIVNDVAVDSTGNIIVAGLFQGTLAFDPANPIASSGSQIYLAKFDKTGLFIWNKIFPSVGTVSVSGVAVDNSDNVLLTGGYTDTITFGGSPLTTTSFEPSFIAKFTPMGGLVFAAPCDYDEVTHIAPPTSDSQGNIVLWGSSVCVQSCQPPGTQLWLQKIQPTGTGIWFKQFYISDAKEDRTAAGVAVDPFDNIFVAGSFSGSETLGSAPFQSAGGFDAFTAIFTSQGALQRADTFGDAVANQAANDIASDAAGNMLILGTYAGKLQFGASKSVTSAGGKDIFVGKMGANGAFDWIKSFGDPSDQTANRISVPHLGPGTLVFTGTTAGNVNYGGGVLPGAGGTDIPLVKLDGGGNYVWSRLFGDAQAQNGAGVVLTNNGESVLCAYVAGSANVGTGALISTGGLDVLIAKFAP